MTHKIRIKGAEEAVINPDMTEVLINLRLADVVALSGALAAARKLLPQIGPTALSRALADVERQLDEIGTALEA